MRVLKIYTKEPDVLVIAVMEVRVCSDYLSNLIVQSIRCLKFKIGVVTRPPTDANQF